MRQNKRILRGITVSRQTRRLTAEDYARIDSAPMPQEEPVPEKIRAALRQQCKNSIRFWLLSTLICLVIGICSLLRRDFIMAAVFGGTILLLLLLLAVSRRNSRISETAVMYRIPVHHAEHSAVTSNQYLVCYLPDGKYRLLFSTGQPFPSAVCQIRDGRYSFRYYL